MAVGKSHFAHHFVERHPEFMHASIDECRIQAMKDHKNQYDNEKIDSILIEEEAWELLHTICLNNEHVVLETSGLSWRLKNILWDADIMVRGIYTVKLMGELNKCLKRLREREPSKVPFPYSFSDEEESCKWLHQNMHRAPHNLIIDVDTDGDYGILIEKAERYIHSARLKYDADLIKYGKNELIIKRGKEMAETRVTKVSFITPKGSGKIRAYANVTLNNEVVIKGYKVAEGSHGLFVGAPSQYSQRDKKWYDSVYYVSEELRNVIHNEILQEYRRKEDSASVETAMNQVEEDEVPF